MQKKVLITGASGFIGSTLCDLGYENGCLVYAATRSSSNRQFLQNPDFRHLTLDLTNPHVLTGQLSALEKKGEAPDWVIHNAGLTRANKREEFFQVNQTFTGHLLQALGNLERPPEKFLLVSSLATYGPGNPKTMAPIQVNDPQRPISTYGKSKLAAEQTLKSQSRIPYIIARPTAVYGPRDRDFLSYFRLVQKGLVPHIGSGPQVLSFIYSRELARLIFRLLEKAPPGSEYLLSDGNAYPKTVMASLLGEILGKKIHQIPIPLAPLRLGIAVRDNLLGLLGRFPFMNAEKFAEISSPNWGCDSSPVFSELDWQSQYPLDKGLQETALWYQREGWL